MDKQQDGPRSNPPIKNALVVAAAIFSSTFIGVWGFIEVTDSLGTVATWIWIGIGLAAVYLLYDIANSVKELGYES